MADEESTAEPEELESAPGDDGEEAVAEPNRELPAEPVLAAIVEPYASSSWETASDEWVVRVAKDEYVELAETARRNGFETFIDLCAVDYFRRDPRFEVVLTVLNYSIPMRLRVMVGLDGPDPVVATVSDVYPGANFYEREAYDLFGIEFSGHPDLTRILMPDDWEGHPLRKDYAVGSVPIQFKGAPQVQ